MKTYKLTIVGEEGEINFTQDFGTCQNCINYLMSLNPVDESPVVEEVVEPVEEVVEEVAEEAEEVEVVEEPTEEVVEEKEEEVEEVAE